METSEHIKECQQLYIRLSILVCYKLQSILQVISVIIVILELQGKAQLQKREIFYLEAVLRKWHNYLCLSSAQRFSLLRTLRM